MRFRDVRVALADAELAHADRHLSSIAGTKICPSPIPTPPFDPGSFHPGALSYEALVLLDRARRKLAKEFREQATLGLKRHPDWHCVPYHAHGQAGNALVGLTSVTASP
jgi:hypothetical protein